MRLLKVDRDGVDIDCGNGVVLELARELSGGDGLYFWGVRIDDRVYCATRTTMAGALHPDSPLMRWIEAAAIHAGLPTPDND